MRISIRGANITFPALFVLARTALFLSLPYEALVGYSDLRTFFSVASLSGWPYLDFWSEFPPLFAFLEKGLFLVAGGREHVFVYLLAFGLTLVQAVNLGLFLRLARVLYPGGSATRRTWLYFALLVGLFYGWGYFDPLAVLALLLGLVFLIEGRAVLVGLAIGLGGLVKWFPLLVLGAVLRKNPPLTFTRHKIGGELLPRWRRSSWDWRSPLTTGIAIGAVLVVYAILWAVSPAYTRASLVSQGSKGSWETLWALLDGNFHTGNFGPLVERYDPSTAQAWRGNPARISPLWTLAGFAVLGGWLFLQAEVERPKQVVAFVGLTLALFFLWSPGWSPQWVLYLLPLVLLTLPWRQSVLMATLLVLANLLEWPLLLSRGLFWGLWLTIPLRTLLFILASVLWFQMVARNSTWGLSEPA